MRTPATPWRPQVVSADEIAALIDDGLTIASEGFTMMGVAEEVYAAIERRFLATGHPPARDKMHPAREIQHAFFEHHL